jgi:RNA polymerase sigma-70 factor (ECF subfamily)
VEESVLYNELNTAIEKEINDLPERCRQAFKLSRKENLTFKEIAAKLDISVNTVEKHVAKALKILRTNLKDYIATFTFLFGR